MDGPVYGILAPWQHVTSWWTYSVLWNWALCFNVVYAGIVSCFNPSHSKCDQFQISLAASPKIWHHAAWRTWLFIAYSDERWLLTNSHHLTYTFLWYKVGRMYTLNLRVEGLIFLEWEAHFFTGVRILRSWETRHPPLRWRPRCGAKGSMVFIETDLSIKRATNSIQLSYCTDGQLTWTQATWNKRRAANDLMSKISFSPTPALIGHDVDAGTSILRNTLIRDFTTCSHADVI